MAHTIAISIAIINDASASGNVIIIPEINIFGNDSKNNSILSLPKIFLLVHGVSLDRKSEISLYLTNETYEDGEYLYICISDTGNGFSKEALDAIENDTPIIYHGRHHVGISNIKRRLALMYGERASITCSNMDENYGAVVEVRLPKTE